MERNGTVPPTKIRNARNETGSLGNARMFIVWKKFVTTFVLFKSWKQCRNDGRESSDCEASTNNYGCDWASWKYEKQQIPSYSLTVHCLGRWSRTAL